MSFVDSLEWFGKVGIYKGVWNIKKGLSGLSNSIRALDFKNLISVVKFIFNPFKQLSLMFRLLQKGFSGLSMALKKVPVIGWLFMAVDGVIGAVEGYKKAGNIFGVETDKLTQGMKISAGAAGGVVGVLDGLTFGLLRLTGVAGPLTEFLAKLFYGFTYLAKGFQDSLMSWMPAIQESLKSVGQAFGELWAMFAGIFGFNITSETDGWKAFYDMMGMVGSVLGAIVGGGLKLLVDILYAAIQVIKAVVWYFSTWINMLRAIGTAIATLSFQPIIDFFGKLGTDILGALGKVFSDLSGWVRSWFGWGKKPESPPATPQVALADGGITTGPTNALIGEAGPEAVIPLDKLSGMMSNNVVAGGDFAKEKALGEQKKLNDFSRSSNNSLKNLERRASTASEGLYVKDTKTHTMLQLLFTQLGYVYESLEAGLNFISQGEEEKMQMARADAKLKRLETTANIADNYVEKGISEEMRQDLMLAYRQAMTGPATAGIENNEYVEQYSDRFGNVEQKEVIQLLKKIEESSRGTRKAVGHGERAGSFYTHDIHMVGEIGDLTNTIDEKIPNPLENDKKELAADRTKPFAPSKPLENTPEYYQYKAVSDSGNFEQNYQTMPEYMWSSRDHVDSRMEKQANMYAASPNFETSAQMASVEGLEENLGRTSIEYGDGQSMGLGEAMEKLKGNLESKAKSRLEEENKEAIAAMDAEIEIKKKEYFNDPSKSIDELMSAKKKKSKFYEENVDKYYLEDSAMASRPGEDPTMLYESYSSAKERTIGRYTDNAASERALVMAQEQELEGLKTKRKEVRGRRSWGSWAMGIDPDKDEIGSIDKRIAEIEGKKSWGYQTDVGSLDASRSRLEMWEKKIKDPGTIERNTIGKNVWTGDSDTSTIFPSEMSSNAVDYAFDTREQVSIEPEKIQGASIPPSEAVQRNLNAIEKFATPAEGEAAEAVLEQNVEQTKKLGTVEEASARSLEPGSIYTHDIHLEKLLSGLGGDRLSLAATTTAAAIDSASAYHATPVGQHAVPVMRGEDDGDVSQVQPVHLRDIAESILKDKVGGEAGTGKLQSDELARMEEIANRQYAEMQQIREGIQEMVSLLRPTGNVVGSGMDEAPKTKFAREHVRPTIYGQMIDGKPGSGPNRSVYKDF